MSLIGMCGDNCFFCPRYTATKIGSVEELEKVKELWVRLGLRDPDFPVQEMACYGCTPENKCAYVELCACVSEKGVANCGLCDEYPCKLITKAFDQSERIRSKAGEVCTQEEMDTLHKAFFSKKEYFDKIH
jgi:hypothetical protein